MILRIGIFYILLSIIPTLLLWIALPTEKRRWWMCLPAIVLATGTLLLFLAAGYVVYKPGVWRIRLLSVTFIYNAPLALYATTLLLGKCFKGYVRRFFSFLSWTISLLLLGLIVYGFTYGTSRIKRTDILIADEQIPAAFDGYKIAVVSDLHVGTYYADTAAIAKKVAAVNAVQPDLICFLGDIVNFSDEELDKFLPTLSQLQAKDGVVSVMGNHDYLYYYPQPDSTDTQRRIHRLEQMERQMGWQLLLNENTVIHRGADSIAIIGAENESKPPHPHRANLHKAMQGISPAAYRILLTHDPTHWHRAITGKTSIPLTFSGHTHGMQMALPGGWSPAALIFKEWSGLYTAGNQRLCVTTGLGESLMPFRLGLPPEVVCVTLRHVSR